MIECEGYGKSAFMKQIYQQIQTQLHLTPQQMYTRFPDVYREMGREERSNTHAQGLLDVNKVVKLEGER